MHSDQLSSAYRFAAEIAEHLGNPTDPGGPFSYREIVLADNDADIPPGARELLEEWRFREHLVPVGLGGRLRAFDEVFLIFRALAQRNMSVAVMYGSTFLGVLPVWLWGTAEQKTKVALGLMNGAHACFALTEREHGSDLRASDTTLGSDRNGYVLTGAKWPVGNATRGRFLITFARSSAQAFSLVLVDREELPARSSTPLPAVPLIGLAGHDVSGVEFHAAPLPHDAVIGTAGTGLTQVVKTLQVTRTAVAALSLGTMDAVLNIALRYSEERRLYGEPISRIPVLRDQLTKGYLDLLISECTVLPVSRALSFAPERMSLWSAIAKYFVPVTADQCVASMASVLGARSYLREGVADGAFQKLQRDHAIASIFEGTTHVNLHWIATQLPALTRRSKHGDHPVPGNLLHHLFDQRSDTPGWVPDGSGMRVSNGGIDEITQSWPTARAELLSLELDPVIRRTLSDLCESVDAVRSAFMERIERDDSWDPGSLTGQSDATTYCYLYTIAACLQMWLRNRGHSSAAFASGEWLVLCFQRLSQRMGTATALDERYAHGFRDRIFRHSAESPLAWLLLHD